MEKLKVENEKDDFKKSVLQYSLYQKRTQRAKSKQFELDYEEQKTELKNSLLDNLKSKNPQTFVNFNQ